MTKAAMSRRVKLEEVSARITVGHVGPMASEYVEDGVPFLRSQNIAPFRINFDDVKFIPLAFHARLKKSALRPGDVVIIRTGYPGVAAVIPPSLPDANCADLVVITPSTSDLDSYYLAAIFNSTWGRATVAGNLVGVAQQHFNIGAARNLEIELPSLPVQRRIANILSAYDDLIENCERRIRVLDQMARALYREWFVLFRYPGHEKAPLVDSVLGPIPKGWAVASLAEGTGTIQDGDWIETKDQGGDDYRLLQISNLGVGTFIETDNYRFVTAQTFSRLNCTEVFPGDILVARMPTPIGRAWLVTPQRWRMITAVDVAIVRTDAAHLLASYLVRGWNDDANLRRIAGQASGTTRPRVTRRDLASLPFVIPPLALQLEFDSLLASGGQFSGVFCESCG